MKQSKLIKCLYAALFCLGLMSVVHGEGARDFRVGRAASAPDSAVARIEARPQQAPERGNQGGGKTGQFAPAAPKAAVEALAAGRREKGEGHLAQAEVQFQKALAAAPRGGDVYRAALEELTYQLPLMRVQRYVLSGQRLKAEHLLQDLLKDHQGDEKKNRHLVGLIARLRKSKPGETGIASEPGSGRKAINSVEQTLSRFYQDHGHYPRGYRELNRILPADRYPLSDYDIVHYVERGHAYGLTLRSKSDPENLLSVQETGLVE